MNENIIRARLYFFEPILGLSPANEDIYRDFVASKAPDAASIEEEVEALGVDAVAEDRMTVFPRMEDGTPFFWDYQIKGFFKDTCGGLRKIKGTESSKIKAFKKQIDKLIFPAPRKIPIIFEGEMGECQRPLRASTPQGERISLAISEEIPAGAHIDVDIIYLSDDDDDLIREWLDYGRLSGISQWRNSGKGRFLWEELDKDGNVIGGNKE